MAEQQEQTAGDVIMTRIGQAVMLHRGGDREEARGRLLELWAEIGEHGDALHRCTLAHYMADTQDDPETELAWDLRALSAASELTEDRVTEHHATLAVRAFSPSLHLNLAADYAKLDRPDAARGHLGQARDASVHLADDEYGDGIRAAIERLALRLEEGSGGSGGSGGETLGPPRQGS